MIDRFMKKLFHISDNRNCQQCGNRMRRIPRTRGDRMLSILIPVIRCECCGPSVLVSPEDGRYELRAASTRTTS